MGDSQIYCKLKGKVLTLCVTHVWLRNNGTNSETAGEGAYMTG